MIGKNLNETVQEIIEKMEIEDCDYMFNCLTGTITSNSNFPYIPRPWLWITPNYYPIFDNYNNYLGFYEFGEFIKI